jgi:7-carboxy-7-deazaguanine synthase
MRETVRERRLGDLGVELLASTVWGKLSPKDLVDWVLEDALPVRVQVQLHKIIWGAEAQGV